MDSPSSDTSLDRAKLAEQRRWLDAMLDHTLLSKSFPYAYYFAPKAACTTIMTLLWRAELKAGGSCAEPPSFEHVHEEQFGPRSPWEPPQSIGARLTSEFEDRTWFLFVRNPYARVYSAYVWLLKDGNAETRAAYLRRFGWGHDRPPSFGAFVELISQQPAWEWDHHWAPITAFTPVRQLGFDFVGAIERFSEDFPPLLAQLFGNQVAFDPKVRMFQSAQRSWADEVKEIPKQAFSQIREMHADDFETFGYADDPMMLEPDAEQLRKIARGGGMSRVLRSRLSLDLLTRNDGPDNATKAIIKARFPAADIGAFKGMVLRNSEMPPWWSAGGSQLWTRLGDPLPSIVPHPGLPNPTNALVVLAATGWPSQIVMWGDAPSVVLGPDTQLLGGLMSCGDNSGVYVGRNVTCEGASQIDARNGGTVFVAGDGLWYSDVKLMADGLHAIRDVDTKARLNPCGGNIIIGRHVWLGHAVHVRGGATIGDDVVVETRSIVDACLPDQSMCEGTPARVVRHGVTWSYENEP